MLNKQFASKGQKKKEAQKAEALKKERESSRILFEKDRQAQANAKFAVADKTAVAPNNKLAEADKVAEGFAEKGKQNKLTSELAKSKELLHSMKDSEFKAAQNFTELIALLRAAEKKLKLAGQNVIQRVKTIRGIYYGTEWSMDFLGPSGKKGEGSTMRNKGFDYFLYGKDALISDNYKANDPRTIIGIKLYTALRDSFEIKNNDNRMVDFGHLIIGMEARMSEESRKDERSDPRSFFTQSLGGTGLEITTWLGDLGGGTGQLARHRVKSPYDSAKRVFTSDLHSYGAEINLEGDIAAFAIGYNKSMGKDKPQNLVINEDIGIAGCLEQYFDNTKQDNQWNQRSKIFLNSYGAIFNKEGNDITNKTQLITILANKIEKFAKVYMETRMKDERNAKKAKNELNDKQEKLIEEEVKKISANLPTSAKDVAEIFIQLLINNSNKPQQPLKP
jgi:hypothetical protein